MNIALVGPQRSGKSTVAEVLVSEYGYGRISLADPVKDACLWACNEFLFHNIGLFPDRWDGLQGKEIPLPIDRQELEDAKDIFRPLLQWWGTDFARRYLKNDNVWIEMFLDRVKHALGPIVCDDVRFPNEASALKEAGFTIIRIERPEEARLAEITNVGSLRHESETALDAISADDTILNRGTVGDLHGEVRCLLLLGGQQNHHADALHV
jgi:hypothetical protein